MYDSLHLVKKYVVLCRQEFSELVSDNVGTPRALWENRGVDKSYKSFSSHPVTHKSGEGE